jgi:ATP-dependent DNA helicase RecQ
VLETRVELRRARLELMLKVLDVDGAVRRVRGGWLPTGEPWSYDTARLSRVAAARESEQRAMLSYATTSQCRMAYLRDCLDDPNSIPCGRCDNCTGTGYPTDVSPSALTAAQAFLGRPGVEIVPRRMWPTGLPAIGVPLSGRIPDSEQALPGRAVGRLSDLGWGDRLRGALAADAAVPDDLVNAVVAVLKEWATGAERWPARPVAVVAVDSVSRPKLVRSLAERIAGIGRLPLLGAVGAGSGTGSGSVNSAQRVRALHQRLAVPPSLTDRLTGLAGPVLLVDDLVDSGWTMALAARLVRRSGAPAVLPLALGLS